MGHMISVKPFKSKNLDNVALDGSNRLRIFSITFFRFGFEPSRGAMIPYKYKNHKLTWLN